MAVQDTDTTQVEDTSVDTSELEDTQDTDVDDTDLEDSDVSFDDETDESSDDLAEESDDDSNDDDDSDDSQEAESEEEAEADDTDAEAPEQQPQQDDDSKEMSEEEEKRHNAEMARQRIAERDARRRQEIARQEAEQRYLDEAKSEKELAEREAAIRNYQTITKANEAVLEASLHRAVADIDLFKTGSPEQRQALAEAAAEFEEIYIVRDEYGSPVDIKKDLYQYLSKKADSIRSLSQVGVRQQTKSKTKQKSRTDTVPTRKPKEAKKDDMLDGFDEEADRW